MLVDLAGFTTGNRLDVFASSPAPVQVSVQSHALSHGVCLFPRKNVHLPKNAIYSLLSALTPTYNLSHKHLNTQRSHVLAMVTPQGSGRSTSLITDDSMPHSTPTGHVDRLS